MKIRFLLLLLLPTVCFGIEKIHQKIVICGICRDVETRLPYTIKIIKDIGNLFDDYKVIIYENNSKDKTVEILSKWKKKNKRLSYISENVRTDDLEKIIVNRNENNSFFRIEEIARARNIVLEKAMSKQYDKYSYIIWIDLDFKIPPNLNGIVETFTSTRDWDAVLAYGIDPPGTFWDWYAFRDAVYPLGSELLGNDWWYMPKKFHLDSSNEWYPVYSGFGGCGIYKKSSIEGCRYSALVTKDLEKLSKKIIDQGKKDMHPQVEKYLNSLNQLENIVTISEPKPNLPKISDPKTGIMLFNFSEPLVWKMSTFVYQYPSVCEHVPFHASMIVNGHGKIFINPRLLFTYGG